MKTVFMLAMVAVAVLIGGSSSGWADGDAGEWVVAYKSDFGDAKAVDNDWISFNGDMKAEGGKLLLLPDKKNKTTAFLDAVGFPKDYRVEITGAVTTKEKPEYLSLGVCLNTFGMDAASGYVVQFGASGNSSSLLKKGGKVIESTVNKTVHVEAGKTFKMVVERVGGKINVMVDGAAVLTYTDDMPIVDSRCGDIGLSSWGCTLAFDQITVYTRKGKAEDIVTRPVPPPAKGPEVTLKGIRMNNVHLRENADWEKSRFVFMVAFDGPPEVKSEVDKIWADYYPGNSIDGNGALELENQFKNRLLYYIDGRLADRIWKDDCWGPGHAVSVTGTIREEGGKKYITATAFGEYEGPTYPERITAGPQKPIVKLPVKPGLSIKLTDALTDTLVYVPAGKFYMGNALAQNVHWQEAPEHMVTFAKGFYLADHPITNAEYAAVTGDKTRNPKNHPEGAACNMSCEMFDAYVKALKALNPGKVFRAPSKSEWEYVARSGTSDIEFKGNPHDRYGETCDRDVDVKSKKPNGWGFYGIAFDDGSERSCDEGFMGDHVWLQDATDPRFPSEICETTPGAYHVHSNGGMSDWPINELLNDEGYVGTELGGKQRNGAGWKLIRERILVEE